MRPRKLKLGFLVLFVFLNLPVVTASGQESFVVEEDPGTGNFLIRYVEEGVQREVIYEPATKITPFVQASASADSSNEAYKLKYKIGSEPESIQRLHSFSIDYGVPIYNTIDPLGWGSHTMTRLPVWAWITSGIFPPGINPGTSAEGFSYEGKGLLGIVFSYFRGYVAPIAFPGEGPPGFDEWFYETAGFPEGMIKIKTLGLKPPPAELVALDFVGHIEDLKHKATELGWITNKGVENSLDVKLNNVRKKLESGNTKAATNVLNAFINEVEAQGCASYDDCPKGKHVLPEAWALLKFNAEYLLGQL